MSGCRLVIVHRSISKKKDSENVDIFVKDAVDFILKIVWQASLADFRTTLADFLKNIWSHCYKLEFRNVLFLCMKKELTPDPLQI